MSTTLPAAASPAFVYPMPPSAAETLPSLQEHRPSVGTLPSLEAVMPVSILVRAAHKILASLRLSPPPFLSLLAQSLYFMRSRDNPVFIGDYLVIVGDP